MLTVENILNFTNSVKENQMGSMLNETEDIHSPCSDESFDTKLQDVYDTEVVLDSEDDATEPVFSEQSSHGISRFVGDLYKVRSTTHYPCEILDRANISTDVKSQPARMIVLQGNDGRSTTVHSSLKDSRLNASDMEIPKALDPCLVNNIANSELGAETKIDYCDRISEAKHRDISIVYTRKRKRTSKFVGNDVEDEKRSLKKSIKDARLSYVESQEPEDISKALLFVDQYVTSNAILSSPVADYIVKNKPMSAQSTNGARNLIGSVHVHRRNRERDNLVFEWDDGQNGNEPSDASSNKVNQTYLRRFSRVRDMNFKDIRNLSDLWKDKTSEPDDMSEKETKQMCEKEDRENTKVPHQQVSEECMVEEGKSCTESDYAFDVGVDTQMAAEAMQDLAYATSIGCSEVDADKCEQIMLKKSSKGSQVKRKSEENGDWTESKSASISKERSCKKTGTGGSMDGWTPDNTTRVDSMHKKRVNEARHDNMDCSKENLWPIRSTQHSQLRKIRSRKKDGITYPVVGNLKSLKALHSNEGPATESVDEYPGLVKVDSCDRRKRSIVNILDMSYQMKNHSKPLNENCMNINDAMVSKEDLIHQSVDHTGTRKSAEVENNPKEIGPFDSDKGKDKSMSYSDSVQNLTKLPCQKFSDARNTRTGQQKASYIPKGSSYWYCRDYPKGKRCKVMPGPTVGSLDLKNSFVKVSSGLNGHHLRGQSHSDVFLKPSFTGFNIVKKRRSSTYLSPCLSQKDSVKSFARCNDCQPKEIDLVHDNHFGPKKMRSEHLVGSSSGLKHGKADNKSSVSTMDDGIRKPNLTVELNKNGISGDAGLPRNSVYKYSKLQEKKASTPSLTRELARLGIRESKPEYTLSDSRKRKTMANVRILLSKHLDDRIHKQLKKILNRFGVSLASSSSNATHFIADKFARTRNMLEFIAQGKPVVTHMWLESCQQAGLYVDETNYILRDMKKEQELGFQLPISLDRARKHPLLKGYSVIVTPNTKPGQEMLTSLVKAVHGQVVEMLTDQILIEKMDLNHLLIVSCEEDRANCLPFLERGKPVYSSELLLNGIIVQKLEFERHRLFMET